MIFVKNPALGKVKTRLAQSIGDEKALQIYLYLLKFTHQITKNLTCDKAVFYSDFIEQHDLWENETYQKYLQSGSHLGERMYQAFEVSFRKGYEKILIIGSDCLELNPEIIQTGFQSLDNQDVVIGPAKDGGYYLLGMKTPLRFIFENKTWSSPTVFEDTIRDLTHHHISYATLPVLSDVDHEEDLDGIDLDNLA